MKEQGVGLKRYRPSDYDEGIGPRSEVVFSKPQRQISDGLLDPGQCG